MPPSSLSPMALLRSLRAVHRYAPDDVLVSIVEVARWTGSAENSQPWKLVVVLNRAGWPSWQAAGHLAGAVAAGTFSRRSAP
jgi:nitroreductase